MEYIDLDNDGIYEIKIPDRIAINTDMGSRPEWMSLFKWDGNAYVLNNEKFYADNNDFLIRLLGEYTYQMLRRGTFISHCETYRFYLGLVYYYRGNRSPSYLQWILKHAKKDAYIQAAESLLKKLPSP